MSRLNLTLDDVTEKRLFRYAQKEGTRQATLATRILKEGLDRREAFERARRLAKDYAAGRADARALLSDLELGQMDLLDEDL